LKRNVLRTVSLCIFCLCALLVCNRRAEAVPVVYENCPTTCPTCSGDGECSVAFLVPLRPQWEEICCTAVGVTWPNNQAHVLVETRECQRFKPLANGNVQPCDSSGGFCNQRMGVISQSYDPECPDWGEA
jgi:hypothetical protein